MQNTLIFSLLPLRERGGCKVSFQLPSDISQERRACRLLLHQEMGQILLSLKCSQRNYFVLIFFHFLHWDWVQGWRSGWPMYTFIVLNKSKSAYILSIINFVAHVFTSYASLFVRIWNKKETFLRMGSTSMLNRPIWPSPNN